MNTRIALAAICLSTSLLASAIPAKRIERTFAQPDGTTVSLRLVGDEFCHYYLTDDGQVVIGRQNGYFFAKASDGGAIEASDVLASDASQRTPAQTAFLKTISADQLMSLATDSPSRMAKRSAPARAIAQSGVGLFPDASFPTKGNTKVLIILVSYKDVDFQVSNPATFFGNMMNQAGFSDYGATGSVTDYFRDNSAGQFVPECDVYGPVTLANNRSYYGGNDSYGYDKAPEKMVIEACKALDSQINFKDYDTDGDGYVDNVYVFYAGQGEASYGPAASVWPHAWDLTSAGQSLTLDGVKIDRYACSNEWESSRPDGIGTFVHEFSHVMGLPDLYDTNSGSAAKLTPGSWSVMDYGPYNNEGRTPPAYSAWERNAMGWIDLLPLVSGTRSDVELPAITSSNKACIVQTSKTNEFFVLENRQQEGWDAYVPGHGMLVWHIDYNSTQWSNNSPNNSSTHQYVDIEEANGKADNTTESTMAGYTFPGTSKKTSFTDTTTPSMKTWSGTALNTPITDIKEAAGVITFVACDDSSDPEDPSDPEGPVGDGTMTFDFTTEGYGMELITSGNTYNPDPFETTVGGITLTLEGRNRWWSSTSGPQLRCYVGSSITISVPTGCTITRVELNGTASDWQLASGFTGSYTNGTWTGSAQSVKLSDKKSSSYTTVKGLTITYTAPEAEVVAGDANGDGAVTIADAVAAICAALGEAPENFVLKAADLNGDGVITISDVVSIVNIILSQE